MVRVLSLLIVGALSLVPAVSMAGEGCPAHKAAQAGLTEVADFHHVIAPLWHDAYPNKDMDKLVAAAPDLASAFARLQTMEVKGSAEKLARYEALSLKLAEAIETYQVAAAAGDAQTVYDIVPLVHDTFEAIAAVASES